MKHNSSVYTDIFIKILNSSTDNLLGSSLNSLGMYLCEDKQFCKLTPYNYIKNRDILIQNMQDADDSDLKAIYSYVDKALFKNIPSDISESAMNRRVARKAATSMGNGVSTCWCLLNLFFIPWARMRELWSLKTAMDMKRNPADLPLKGTFKYLMFYTVILLEVNLKSIDALQQNELSMVFTTGVQTLERLAVEGNGNLENTSVINCGRNIVSRYMRSEEGK